MKFNTSALQAHIDRARRAVANCGNITYKMGQGGTEPADPCPSRNGKCDCTGFISWVLGIDRFQGDKKKWFSKFLPWVETTAIYKDATGPQRVFVKIPEPVEGCMVVFPDKWMGLSSGHIGLVTRIVKTDGKLYLTGIDCSSGSSKKYGKAIMERDFALFTRLKAVYVVLKQDVISE